MNKEDLRYWKILSMVSKFDKKGIAKTKLDKIAINVVSNNMVTVILDNLHNDHLIIYPPKGEGWRKGQSRIAKITEKGRQELNYYFLKKKILDRLKDYRISEEQTKDILKILEVEN